MVRDLASNLHSTSVAQFNCTAGSGPRDLEGLLRRVCSVVPTSDGSVLRPRNSENLLILLKDLNVSKPDKWGTAVFISFVQQICSIGGFYDGDGEFIQVDLSKVVFVGTLVPSSGGSAGGRHDLSQRLAGAMRICHVNQPDREELNGVVRCYYDCCNQLLPEPVRVSRWVSAEDFVPAAVDVWSRVQLHSESTTTSTGSAPAGSVATLSPRSLHQWIFSAL